MIRKWTLRDGLDAFLIKASREALEQYRHQCLWTAILAPWVKDLKHPEVPALLRDDDGYDP